MSLYALWRPLIEQMWASNRDRVAKMRKKDDEDIHTTWRQTSLSSRHSVHALSKEQEYPLIDWPGRFLSAHDFCHSLSLRTSLIERKREGERER